MPSEEERTVNPKNTVLYNPVLQTKTVTRQALEDQHMYM